ncbi:transcription regulator protein BACH1b isoform X2 [Scleropages formosus]|uniref:BTB and CNC homology 1, basic leucine zipper transcription factor 1 b n=2 Tax=Scleropages formosus TaxID=113540 RepID=A0A8C9RDK8_SCLFO|nr:transcription regulator protein BACH1 isoform X2 [Scleropages formosus]XP_018610906.1 transcription regulator protein BACH1 isoform X2 [Scleropages formosus]XP_018610908.1 transcription regulator protein BACH1 isoform X2 [Scleropages formosus]XP_018610909.1 transcription regulator protein BACH1 isoform X2 [Scleropages formosus]XP_018610910.1 transcription regulator protein BACH1 isoform X2 [Scleropages formosus]
MSFESSRTSMFTFQSSVHSSHVLQCLDEQRQKDILCDLTVVVENRSFRAHRSVLASCSDYFHARVTNHVGHGLVISLPSEVTVAGFDPLLQFAYTAKLLFTKENILEIRNCAIFLGFRNLDKACFEFLIPKFFDSSKSTPTVHRKSRWKSKCCMEKSSVSKSSINLDDGEDNDNEEEERKNNQSLDGLQKHKGDKASCQEAKAQADILRSCSLVCQEKSKQTDYSIPCVDNCKTPIKEQICPGLSSKGSVSPATPRASSDSTDQAGSHCCSSKSNLAQVTCEKVVMVSSCLPCVPSLPGNPNSLGFMESQHLACNQPVEAEDVQRKGCPVGPFEGCRFMPLPRLESDYQPLCYGFPYSLTKRDWEGEGRRSTVEREVAEHLARGFWQDLSFQTERSAANKCANIPCLLPLHQDSSKEGCPFLPELEPGKREVPSREALLEKSSYSSCVQSGEDSEFDTEGESESCTSERVCEVQLPFSVEQIAALNRNDFQQLLKQHPLTQEQLDFVHDVRRRSKNRIAAQRCRKRKLDCIHNLEYEIDKLRTEKEKLLQEQNLLNKLKLKTRQSLSDLCQWMCSEAKLQPDQLQMLAKYSSPDCPLSALVTQRPSHSSSPSLHDRAQENIYPSSACSTADTPLTVPMTDSRGYHLTGETHKVPCATLPLRPSEATALRRLADRPPKERDNPSANSHVVVDASSTCTIDQ